MANDITAPRLWVLDTAEAVIAAGTPVIVRAVTFMGTTAGHDLVINEFDASGAEKPAIVMKMQGTEVVYPHLDFGCNGRLLNGLHVATIDSGSAYVYIGKD